MSRTYNSINAAKFRASRAEKAWAELVEGLRSAAAESDYCGPDPGVVESIAGEIAGVRLALRTWGIAEVVRRRRVRRLSGGRARAILDAVSRG